jgi:hypothetical protein
MYDSYSEDEYRAWTDRAQMKGVGYLNYAVNFDDVEAHSSAGNDRAILYDSSGDDAIQVRDWGVRLVSADARHAVGGFDYIAALSSSGNDLKEVDAVDYLFELIGDWK